MSVLAGWSCFLAGVCTAAHASVIDAQAFDGIRAAGNRQDAIPMTS